MSLFKSMLAAAIAALTVLPAAAETITLGSLTISAPWVRATPPNAPAGGGFLTITNTGAADRLIAVASDASDKTEIHEMSVVNGVMKMRALPDGLEIPTGETVTLAPGGFHIMFVGLKAPFKEGGTVMATLTFENAGTVEIPFTIEKIGARGPAGTGDVGHGCDHGDHGDHGHSH